MRLVLLVLPLVLSPPMAAPPPILDMHMHAAQVEDFAKLMGPPPIPHCVPMTDYPVPEKAREFRETVRSRTLPCKAIWSPGLTMR